jgi:drug/metabolite transporter (DMT)-like permease
MEGMVLIAFVAAFGVAAQFLLTKAYTMTNPSFTAPFEYSALIWAAISGYLLWQDVPDIWSVVGALLIVGSGIYIIYREARVGKKRES